MNPLAPGHAQLADVAESVFYLDQIYPADVCEPRKHEQHLMTARRGLRTDNLQLTTEPEASSSDHCSVTLHSDRLHRESAFRVRAYLGDDQRVDRGTSCAVVRVDDLLHRHHRDVAEGALGTPALSDLQSYEQGSPANGRHRRECCLRAEPVQKVGARQKVLVAVRLRGRQHDRIGAREPGSQLDRSVGQIYESRGSLPSREAGRHLRQVGSVIRTHRFCGRKRQASKQFGQRFSSTTGQRIQVRGSHSRQCKAVGLSSKRRKGEAMTIHDGRTTGIDLYGPTVGDMEAEAAAQVIRSGRLSQGTQVAEVEATVAELMGAQVVAVSSGSAALDVVIHMLDLQPGDEVIMPSLTFAAGAASVLRRRGVPRFVDVVSPEHPVLSCDAVSAALTDRTRAVVTMHYGGYPAIGQALVETCRSAGVPLIEDSAHAFATPNKLGVLGAIGDLGILSTFATKNVTSAEGGFVVARNPEHFERAHRLRNHGYAPGRGARNWGENDGGDSQELRLWADARGVRMRYDIMEAGFNYRMSDVHAAVLAGQLRRREADQLRRERVVLRYRENLASTEQVVPVCRDVPVESSGLHLMVAICSSSELRDNVTAALDEAGIGWALHYPPTHLLSAFEHLAPVDSLPETMAVARRAVSLPLHSTLTEAHVDRVCEVVLSAVEDHA